MIVVRWTEKAGKIGSVNLSSPEGRKEGWKRGKGEDRQKEGHGLMEGKEKITSKGRREDERQDLL